MSGPGPQWQDPPDEPVDAAGNDAEARMLAVLRRHESELLAREGVQGVGLGRNEIGEPVIVLYLARALPQGAVPASLEGCPVATEIVGSVEAY